ncbi:uncharacterized protein BO88DRAFT_459838 [Aspergillus vadensis CBS 113365]|uniref:Uncharacterized protein n=1 Tax=Aspergillus vadensis (strain CBS 113365 / IMI 142717 / IBT 24658) TaxID=1448311 RepID=A0A319CGB4_ASPVC|nr:hypothetical protein BO88DRAFT_459838 [Aspergillus vadensis CBS 113365]PYH74408.1 hypothetical protein BO88DRAFT_459838 [Aspergillus vadensis CBS 113365]
MDASTTADIRDRILHQIHGLLFEVLRESEDTGPMRILGDTPNSILDPKDYLASIRPFVTEIQNCIHEFDANSKTCFIAVNIYPGKHSYFVVDLNNTEYDYQTAHECKTFPVPVHILRLSKRNPPRIYRKRELDGQLAETLRIMHNGHGQDPLPLVDNYCDPNRQYSNPRSLKTLMSRVFRFAH